jgi:hypothetical protein
MSIVYGHLFRTSVLVVARPEETMQVVDTGLHIMMPKEPDDMSRKC